MRRLCVSSVLVLALAAPLLAAPPEVPREVKAQPGQPVRVLVKGGELGFKATFADDEAFFDELTAKDGQRRFMFQATKPGRYAVVFWTKGETDGAVTTIVVGDSVDPKPDPDPKPKPEPDPKPAPVSASWVIVVEETTQRTPATSAVLSDLAMWRRIEAKGVKWRLYDKDSADAKAKQYDQFAAPVGLPAVLLLDAGGKVVKAVKLPATAGELESLAGGK